MTWLYQDYMFSVYLNSLLVANLRVNEQMGILAISTAYQHKDNL